MVGTKPGVKAIATLLLALLTIAASGAFGNAPADRYFGRLKMSALRIRYEIMQVRARYESHKLLPEEAEHLLDLDADAFYAWAKAYPHDTWLASSGYLLAGLYAELPGNAARASANQAYKFVAAGFRSTSYGQKSVAVLHRGGVPLRPDPAWAQGMRAARVTPSPSPAPSTAPSASANPASSAAPSPSPSPSPSPATGSGSLYL